MLVESPFFKLGDFFHVAKRRKKIILLVYIPLIFSSIFLLNDREKIYETKLTINNSGPFIDAQTLNDNFKVYYSNILENDHNSVYKYLKDIQIRHSEYINDSIYTVNLKVGDIKVVNKIVAELIFFCNKNPITKNYIEVQNSKLTNLLEIKKRQLNNLKSLIKLYKSDKNSLTSTFQFIIFNDIVLLEEKVIALKEEEKENKGFFISIEPTIPNQAKEVNIFVLAFILTVSELFIVLFIVFFMDKYLSVSKS